MSAWHIIANGCSLHKGGRTFFLEVLFHEANEQETEVRSRIATLLPEGASKHSS